MRVTRIDRLGRIRFDRRPAIADALPLLEEEIVARTTIDGYLRVDGRISGTGVYEYEDGDGNKWGELRTPDDVFANDSLVSFAMLAVTDDHPAVMVDASNIRNVQCGQLGSRQRPDGEYVISDMLITDAALIEKIKAGKCELSCGYTAVLVDESGELGGKPYSYRQTEIRGNHLSVVDEARGGPECRLLLDSKGAISKGRDSMKVQKKNAKVVIGGTELEVPDAVVEEMTRLQSKIEEQGAELAKLSNGAVEADEDVPDEPAVETEVMAAKDSKGSARDRARIDALEARIANEPARIDARVNLVVKAREILGADCKTDGVPDIALMRAVASHVTPALKAKVDAGSSDYVTAAYEMALESHAARVDSTGELGELVYSAAAHGDSMDLDALYTAHVDGRSRRNRSARKESV